MVEVQGGPTAGGTVVVVSKYWWAGRNNAGDFGVYLDGKRVGKVAPQSQRQFQVSDGKHTVRVRLWWFLSPKVMVEVQSGQTVRLVADVPRDKSVLRGMGKLVRSGLSLTAATTS